MNDSSIADWYPSITKKHLLERANVLKKIRDFFAAKNVLEVETPLLCYTSVTDPHIQSIPAYIQPHPNAKEERYYLQTSPEYAMKRLLAAGSGAIYQITKAFRQGEIGHLHNPEFTMLEWYRPGFNHHDLMNEVDELLQCTLNTPAAERKSYAELFQLFLNLDPHTVTVEELAACANKHNITVTDNISDCDTWLSILSTHVIEPQLTGDRPIFIYDFPVSQAALAKIQPGNPPVASRFEVYFKGIELANGFHELQNADEQRKRFEKNLATRKMLQLQELPIDEYLLAALTYGLPDCSGVALGIDRLLMLITQSNHIADILSFDAKKVEPPK